MGDHAGNSVKTNPIIDVELLKVQSSGLLVALKDGSGRRGFIRWREVSWDRRIAHPIEIPKAIFQAVILDEEARPGSLFLSIRRLTNPWQTVLQKFTPGQVVEGEVVNVRHFGVYVQIEPGIDGVLRPREAPLLHDQNLEEILFIGDRLQAKIKEIGMQNNLLELNLNSLLEERDRQSGEERIQRLLELFGANQHPHPISPVSSHPATPGVLPQPETNVLVKTLGDLKRVLIVDNQPAALEYLRASLVNQYGPSLHVDLVETGDAALDIVQHAPAYNLALVDCHLDGELGIDVARRLRRSEPDLPILLISGAHTGCEDDPNQAAQVEFPFSSKDLQELLPTIDDLRVGLWRKAPPAPVTSQESYIRELDMQAMTRRPLPSLLEDVLEKLRGETGVTYCLVLEMEAQEKRIHVLAARPAISEQELLGIQEGLYYSPARQVIENRQEFLRNKIQLESDERFKYLFPGLNFESCLGLPVEIPDHDPRYGLFLLDLSPRGFRGERSRGDDQRLQQARSASQRLSIAIERAMLLEYMRRYQDRFSQGQLLADLVHETNNKLNILEKKFNILAKLFSQRSGAADQQAAATWADALEKGIQAAVEMHDELKELIDSYDRQAGSRYESIHMNEIVEAAVVALRERAGKGGVILKSDCCDSPALCVRGVRSHLQQVILNLGLNAIQMIEYEQHLLKLRASQLGHRMPLMTRGAVIIQTRFHPESPLSVEIRVIDSGPGIHLRDQLDIFKQGVSRRGGAGRGLSISRNLIERMGGQVTLMDSLLYTGSAFLVELPGERPAEEQK